MPRKFFLKQVLPRERRSMIDNLFATGISVSQMYPSSENKWIATIRYEDESHAELGGVKGTLNNKYGDDLLEACKTVLENSEKIGIRMVSLPNQKPRLYVIELVSDNSEIWEQITSTANALEFEVCDCINRKSN